MLALMGDTIDNIKGVPGIGEKGARELISTYGTLDELLAHAAEVPQKKYREALLAHADEARSSRELLRIRTDVPVAFDIDAFDYRGPSRERCYELFQRARLSHRWSMEYAPTAETIARRLPARHDDRTSFDELAESCERRGGSRCASCPTRHPPSTRAGIVGIAFSTARAIGAAIVPLRHHGMHQRPAADRSTRRSQVLEAVARGSRRFEKIGHDLKFDAIVLARHGVTLARPRPRHDAGELSAGCDAVGPPARRRSARAHRLQGAHRRRRLRPRRQGGVAGRRPAGSGARLRRRARRPGAAASPIGSGPCWSTTVSTAVYRDLELPLIPVLVAIERAGVRIDGARWPGSRSRSIRSWRRGARRFSRSPAKRSTSIRRSSCRKSCSTSCSCRRCKRNVKTKTASTAVEVLEELALDARSAAADSRVARVCRS